MTVLAVLAVVGALLSFVAGIILMLSGGLGAAAGAASQGWTVMVFGSLMFALALVGFALGYGFWTMKRWSWSVALVVYSVGIAMNLASVFLAGASLVSVVVPVAIGAGVIWFLFQPQTRAALGH